MLVVQLHAEHGSGQHGLYTPFDLDMIFFHDSLSEWNPAINESISRRYRRSPGRTQEIGAAVAGRDFRTAELVAIACAARVLRAAATA